MFHRLAFPLIFFLAPRLLPKVLKFAKLVCRLTFDKRVSIFLRALVPLAILYVILPSPNLISDRIPIFGWLDDVIIMGLALLFLTKGASPVIVDEHLDRVPKSDRPEDKDPDKVVDGSSRLIDDE